MWQLCVVVVLLGGVTCRHLIDLTHTLDENVPKWAVKDNSMGNMSAYKLRTIDEKWHPNGMWLSVKHMELVEHIGTHMDAPYHFGAGRQTMEQIPVEKLMGPGVNINVRDKAMIDPNYGVTVDDIKEYEETYGRIPRNAIVMMNSGWGEKFNNANLVFGTDNLVFGAPVNFPGWSLEACKFLLSERQITAVGVDSPSIDPGNFTGSFPCHRYLLPNSALALEYVANLDAMPAAGCTIFLGAIKHRGGTGGQTRIVCVLDDGEGSSASGSLTGPTLISLMTSAMVLLM